jgi:hypothetical protein
MVSRYGSVCLLAQSKRTCSRASWLAVVISRNCGLGTRVSRQADYVTHDQEFQDWHTKESPTSMQVKDTS